MARLRFLSSFVLAVFIVHVIGGQAYAFPSPQEQSTSRVHVVSPDQLTRDLLRHHEAREATLAKIGALLQQPEVKQSLALMGADWTEVEERVAALTAAELVDIGSRIDAISEQYPGGLSTAAWIVLAVAGVIVVALIVWAIVVDDATDALFGS